MKGFITSWKSLTGEILEELYIAREKLSKEGRPKTEPTGSVYTWVGYLNDIGLAKTTANRWLKRWMTPEIREVKSIYHNVQSGQKESFSPLQD